MEEIFEKLNYTEEKKNLCRNYSRDGYIVIDPQIPDIGTTAERILDALEERFKTKDRVIDAWQFNQNVRDLAILPKVYETLETLYGRRPIPFQTLNFKFGTEQATHSDTIHFNSIPEGFMCGVWIALEDIDENNGPLHYYAGSHRIPRYDFSHLGIAASLNQKTMKTEIGPQLPKLIEDIARAKDLKKIRGLIGQGQAIIWAAGTYHGGEPIRDRSRTRYSQVTHYYFENCTYYTPYFSDPVLGNVFFRKVIDIKTNQRVRSTYCERDDIDYTKPKSSKPPSRKRDILGTVIARLWK